MCLFATPSATRPTSSVYGLLPEHRTLRLPDPNSIQKVTILKEQDKEHGTGHEQTARKYSNENAELANASLKAHWIETCGGVWGAIVIADEWTDHMSCFVAYALNHSWREIPPVRKIAAITSIPFSSG